jgi:hypothetical protein
MMCDALFLIGELNKLDDVDVDDSISIYTAPIKVGDMLMTVGQLSVHVNELCRVINSQMSIPPHSMPSLHEPFAPSDPQQQYTRQEKHSRHEEYPSPTSRSTESGRDRRHRDSRGSGHSRHRAPMRAHRHRPSVGYN